ncbi:MAG: hypothetical protein ACLR56_10835 [Oscillospiraceae bacterium]
MERTKKEKSKKDPSDADIFDTEEDRNLRSMTLKRSRRSGRAVYGAAHARYRFDEEPTDDELKLRKWTLTLDDLSRQYEP